MSIGFDILEHSLSIISLHTYHGWSGDFSPHVINTQTPFPHFTLSGAVKYDFRINEHRLGNKIIPLTFLNDHLLGMGTLAERPTQSLQNEPWLQTYHQEILGSADSQSLQDRQDWRSAEEPGFPTFAIDSTAILPYSLFFSVHIFDQKRMLRYLTTHGA